MEINPGYPQNCENFKCLKYFELLNIGIRKGLRIWPSCRRGVPCKFKNILDFFKKC